MFRISKENRDFSIVMFLYYAGYCVMFSYIVVFFKHIGYTESTIGVILAVTNILNLIAQPVYGYLSDHVITVKKILSINLTLTVFVASLLPVIKNNFCLVFIVYAIISLTERPLITTLDSYIVKLSNKRSGLNYGFVRGIGSFGYALVGLIIGRVIDLYGFTFMFVTHTLLILFSLLFLFRLEDFPLVKETPKDDADKAQNKIGFIHSAKQLLKIRSYVMFILAAFIAFVGINSCQTYLPILIEFRGGSSKDFGMAIFLMAGSEVPILINYSRIVRRIHEKYLLLLSLSMFFLKFILSIYITSVAGITIIQAMQAFSYALFLPSFLRVIQSLIPEALSATGITLAIALYGGTSAILGPLASGFLIERFGIIFIYYAGALCCLFGALILGIEIFVLKKPAEGD